MPGVYARLQEAAISYDAPLATEFIAKPFPGAAVAPCKGRLGAS